MDEKMNYTGNSNKQKAEAEKTDKNVEKVVEGNVVQRRRSTWSRIAENFKGEDMNTVGQYILFEVLIPAAKNMIFDAGKEGLDRMLFGGSRVTTSSSRSTNYTSYNNIYKKKDEPRQLSKNARANHDFGEIVLESRGEAEAVLDKLQGLIDQFDVATVADLYDLLGVTGSFTDNKWGWTDLRGAEARRVREGYLLDLPRTSPID